MAFASGWVAVAISGLVATIVASSVDDLGPVEAIIYFVIVSLMPVGLVLAARWAYLRVIRSEAAVWKLNVLYIGAAWTTLVMLSKLVSG